MKEMLSIASNTILLPRQKEADGPPKVEGRVELILIASEPVYSYGVEGMKRDRAISEYRVTASVDALRRMSESLLAMADDAEAAAELINEATGTPD